MDAQQRAPLGVLVFEPEHDGHQPAYVRILAEWLSTRELRSKVAFAVSARLLERLRLEDRFDLQQVSDGRVLTIDRGAADACFQGPLYRRSFARMRLIRRLVRTNPVRHVISLFLDPLQLSLAFGQWPGEGTTLSGILFRPSLHEIYTDSAAPPLSERFRDRRKRILYRMMLRNPALTRVLSLDPYFPAYAASVFGKAHKVVGIPDPVVTHNLVQGAGIGPDLREALRGQRVVFTLFGALTDRKGVCQVLDAVALLPPVTRARIRVVLAGRIDPAVAAEVHSRANLLVAPGVEGECLGILDRFLTTPELAWLVSESSVILAPYQRFVGSSGVLTWAAAQRRPVIAQQYGLIGALVRDYRLGLATDTSDPSRIAEAMAELADPHRLDSIAARARWPDFLVGRTAEDFAASVFADLVDRDMESRC